MNSNILTLIALLVIAAGGYLIYFLYSRVQQRKHDALYSPKKFEEWMAAQGFTPDDCSFFHGTGIALLDGDDRLAISHNSTTALYALTQIISVKPGRFIEAVRPLGAAPGVVEKRDILRFKIDISFSPNDVATILFETLDQMQAWEQRLVKRMS